ncbi:unnamed protein product [Sphenostylis stenocarpa]|uniref:Uncharacterized protein n=1 Tax=Sphenostylis stenocarpa TaxID=92480 RepID=A0AA87BC12_9FABA|nr:unnamed protein product [Sphenostylis stenocarpa]
MKENHVIMDWSVDPGLAAFIAEEITIKESIATRKPTKAEITTHSERGKHDSGEGGVVQKNVGGVVK